MLFYSHFRIPQVGHNNITSIVILILVVTIILCLKQMNQDLERLEVEENDNTFLVIFFVFFFLIHLIDYKISCPIIACYFSSADLISSDFDAFLYGYALIAFGGPGVHISFIHLSNLYPHHKATVISIFNGIFSMSGLTFLGFQVRHCSFILSQLIQFSYFIPILHLSPDKTYFLAMQLYSLQLSYPAQLCGPGSASYWKWFTKKRPHSSISLFGNH